MVTVFVIAVIFLIPLKILGYGYIPQDDALRHSAKVISGKNWNDILVLRDEIKMDTHPGWHFILAFAGKLFACGTDGLVFFSVFVLFVLFCMTPLVFLNRLEAWIITLAAVSVANPTFITRLLMGRPYIVSAAVVLALCFLWPRLKDKKAFSAAFAALVVLFTLATWVHCSWYLMAIPVLAIFLAREWRAGAAASAALAAGIVLGACLTGKPMLFLQQTLFQSYLTLSNHQLSRMLAIEFQPFRGDQFSVMLVLALIVWRKLRGAWNPKFVDNPVFILLSMSWAMGFINQRFWLDIGMPALCAWLASEFDYYLSEKISASSWRRVAIILIASGVLYLSITNDIESRWTRNLSIEYLSAENPEHAEWLPGKGGIVYSDDMTIFYQTFFKNPHAPWRYILGFEPAVMPPDDLAIFRKIQWNFGAYKSFAPWVAKMRPEDRLIIRRDAAVKPDIPGLEWHYTASGIWIGRIPKKGSHD